MYIRWGECYLFIVKILKYEREQTIKLKQANKNRAGEGQNLGKLTGERCANSEANKQASWDWVDSSDQANPLGGPINREADWLRPAQRKLGRPSRPRPD